MKYIDTFYSQELINKYPEIAQEAGLTNKDYYWVLCHIKDNKPIQYIAHDGGEPEDQVFVRDLNWIAPLLNNYEERLHALNKQANELSNFDLDSYLENILLELDELNYWTYGTFTYEGYDLARDSLRIEYHLNYKDYNDSIDVDIEDIYNRLPTKEIAIKINDEEERRKAFEREKQEKQKKDLEKKEYESYLYLKNKYEKSCKN